MAKVYTTSLRASTGLLLGTYVAHGSHDRLTWLMVCNMTQCYWSKQDGNGTVVWADAHLTQSGVEQAEIANRFWAKEIEEQRIPTPQTYYTSPLTRCLDTANITFSGLDLPARHPFVPTVKEVSP